VSYFTLRITVILMETINDLDNQHGLRLHRPFHLEGQAATTAKTTPEHPPPLRQDNTTCSTGTPRSET